jgi:hypothetical protein
MELLECTLKLTAPLQRDRRVCVRTLTTTRPARSRPWCVGASSQRADVGPLARSLSPCIAAALPTARAAIAGRHLTARRSSSIADAATAGLRRWVRRRERFAGRERGRHEDLEIDVPDRALALDEDGLREVAQHLAAEEAVAVLLLGRKVEARGPNATDAR